MSDSVELIIKAANGSVADFKMSAQPNWTVTQVKNHIYRHYPTHPPLTSQRLIHSGRMLLDQQTLIEALPDLSSAIQPIIVHLVAYERSASAPVLSQSSSSSSSSSSSRTQPRRQRSTASRQTSLSPVQEAADGARGEGGRGGEAPPVSNGRSQHPQGQPAQNPWLRYRGAGVHQQQNVPAQVFMPMAGGFPPQLAGGFPPQMGGVFPPQMGGAFVQPQFYHPYGAAYANQMAQYWGYYNQYGREPGAAGDGMTVEGGEVVEDLDLQNLQDLANNPDVEDQGVPMNAGGVGMMAGGGAAQFQRRRDLVDYLYMLTMMGFLALIAYVTGSFGRLLVFAGGIIFMMLNQRGWFSLQRRRPVRQREEQNPLERAGQQQEQGGEGRAEEDAAQENNENLDESQGVVETDGQETEEHLTTDRDSSGTPGGGAPDSQQSQQEPPHEEAEEEGDGDVAVGGQEESAPPRQRPEEQQQEQQPRPGILATILVFVTSFFTSLVPQQRPELQFN